MQEIKLRHQYILDTGDMTPASLDLREVAPGGGQAAGRERLVVIASGPMFVSAAATKQTHHTFRISNLKALSTRHHPRCGLQDAGVLSPVPCAYRCGSIISCILHSARTTGRQFRTLDLPLRASRTLESSPPCTAVLRLFNERLDGSIFYHAT